MTVAIFLTGWHPLNQASSLAVAFIPSQEGMANTRGQSFLSRDQAELAGALFLWSRVEVLRGCVLQP